MMTRNLFLILCGVFLFSVISEASRKRRGFPFDFMYGGASAFAGPSTGAFASSSSGDDDFGYPSFPYAFGFAPFFNPFANPYGFPRFPKFTIPKSWYQGPNVCQETRYVPYEDDDFFNVGGSPGFNFRVRSSSCRGNETVVLCKQTVHTNEGMKDCYTRYSCCPGFVRNPIGEGCIQVTGPNGAPVSTQSSTGFDKSTEYSFVPKSDSSAKAAAVGGVPPQ